MTVPTPAVILLGAETYPKWPTLSNAAFGQSSQAFHQYCRDTLKVPENHVLDLFGLPAAADETVHLIQEFLAGDDTEPCDVVIVHYVGHGGRVGVDGQFAVFTANASETAPDASSLRLSQLDEATKAASRTRPVILLIDACFAAAAAKAFLQPAGSAGLSILASSSASRKSLVPDGAQATVFTSGLLAVLARGSWAHGQMLTLRELCELTVKELPPDAKPEVHSPRQRDGDAADRPLLPNAVFQPRHDPDDTGRPWCAVISQSDDQGTFSLLMDRFAGQAIWKIQNESGVELRQRPDIVDAATVFAGAEAFRAAVATVCAADLAFFDMTSLEPAVLVLLGIRAVIRRGVTVCSVAKGTGELLQAPPFLLRDINFVQHDSRRKSVGLLSDRAIAGMTEMRHSPHRYADLPGFDAVRQLPPGLDSRPEIPYTEQILVLCSFDDDYNADNWPDVEGAITTLIGLRTKQTVRVQRTLEMTSTRLISASLLEAIRFTDFCLCDLTGWRPNVLFELGFRLAANPVEPVCVVDRAQSGVDDPGPGVGQRKDLLRLFQVMEYTPKKDEDFTLIVDRHLRNLDQEETSRLTGGPGVYAAAWRHADPVAERSSTDVVGLLQQVAADQSSDKTSGSWPLLFPPRHPLAVEAEGNAVEALIAAWLYLHDDRAAGRPDRDAKISEVGNQLYLLLRDSPRDADRRLARTILAEIEEGADGE